jgi:hypothetical protein
MDVEVRSDMNKNPVHDHASGGGLTSRTIGAGTAIGIAIGAVIGAVTDNMGVGLGLGIGIGLAVAIAFNETRPTSRG